jgi:hypothetical protein
MTAGWWGAQAGFQITNLRFQIVGVAGAAIRVDGGGEGR